MLRNSASSKSTQVKMISIQLDTTKKKWNSKKSVSRTT